MIVITWAGFVLLYNASGRSFRLGKIPEVNVIEPNPEYVLEHWLQKIEQETGKRFKEKPVKKIESKKEIINEIQTFPSLHQDLAATVSKPKSWESFEDKRPPEIELEPDKLFEEKPESKTEFKRESINEIQALPSLHEDLAVAVSKPKSWESLEDRGPPEIELSEEKPESKTEFRKESVHEIQAFPSLHEDLAPAVTKPESWESFKDREPPKIEEEFDKLFEEKPESKTEFKKETINEIRGFPSLGQDLAAARSKPESWESFENRRPFKQIIQGSFTELKSSSSQDLLEDRTRIQFTRWSQTRVYRATSDCDQDCDMRKDPMQQRLDQVSKSVSRVMFQTGSTPSETSIQIKN